MKKYKLLINFVYFSNIKLLDKAKHILASLEPNVGLTLAIQVPYYDELNQVTIDFEEAMEKAKNGDRVEIAKRNQIRTTVIDALLQIKAFLELNYGSDYVTLVSSGYDLQKERTPIGELPTPANIQLTSTQERCIMVNIKAVKGAKMYVCEYGLANEEATQLIVNSKSTFKITDLPSASIFRVRAAAVGTGSSRNFTQYKTVVVS
ncbi:hypothetical protein H1R17_11085 [Flavobacterium sp. xlx-214]|uniref:hypothetical protein n=1 Tax=unclassified Flavobacterium TaxID=196869 RepID=UPI0013D0FFA4|nr:MULTISPECIES: hypothetical protein [unclassified Flavobacterium]MBA5791758.1 hypothetical protein [Flavobacterium sp. xlx-221]QMI82997.1 hypothetical protein H1R17_11085 [Flavobacterium sp. xlx-214]